MQKDGERYCNCCGKKFVQAGNLYLEEFVQIEKSWGYFSEHDGMDLSLDVCERCFQEWIGTFCHKPQMTERVEI